MLLQNQTLSLLTLSHPLPHLSFAPPHHPIKLFSKFNPKSGFGFCNSVKPISQTGMRRPCGGLVMVKCGNGGEEEGIIKDDSFYIRRCVEVAKKAIGHTSPNPLVGCVIVKDGKVVGEGFHPKAGQPHAEVFALRDAGDLAENATAYVSLEPCNHYGRTPPCSEALIKAKVKKVVVGMIDPNPLVASKGVDRLRDAGIHVVVGVEEALCRRLNEGFINKMMTGKPLVTLRCSLSVNGHVLNQLGEGAMTSGGYYSKLLQEYDAVILSASVIDKSPLPASQEPGANQPIWIVTAKATSSPIRIPNLTEAEASKVIIFAEKETVVEPETAKKGIETVFMDQISFDAILEYCNHRGQCSVMLDLRGSFAEFEELLNEGIHQNLVQKAIVEVLPLLDENSGRNSLGLLDAVTKKLENLQPKFSDNSIVMEVYL